VLEDESRMSRKRKIDDMDTAGLDEAALDPIRRRVLRRSRELRLSLAALSRRLNRNEAYMHQFMWRGSPKDLPEPVRRPLAQILGVDEAELRGEEPGPAPAPVLAGGGGMPSAPHRDIPVWRIGDLLAAPPSEWAPRPPALAGVARAFALWVAEPAGRARPGDLAYVHPTQPARLGDMVAQVDREDRVIGLGELLSATQVDDETGRHAIDRAAVRLCKVVCLELA
jgi:hypothetical protein